MLVLGIFSVTKMYKAEHSNLCKHTKLDLLAKIFAKVLDLLVNLWYTIIKVKDRGRKPTDNQGGKHYDDDKKPYRQPRTNND